MTQDQIKEKPILFNTEMVQAILEGRKTQTRRPHKVTDPRFTGLKWEDKWTRVRNNPGFFEGYDLGDYEQWIDRVKSPFGMPGDKLWVRETFTVAHVNTWGGLPKVVHQNGLEAAYFKAGFDRSKPSKWMPSIHMPRWACRLELLVKRVWVERVQDITEEGACKEGCISKKPAGIGGQIVGMGAVPTTGYKLEFSKLWNSIYNNWQSNPWVWCCEFEVIKK